MEEFRRPGAAALDDVVVTHQLSSRSRRAPDPVRENDALHALVRDLADKPRQVLQLLVDIALDLCDAGSAGVSLRERTPDGGELFRWITAAGQLAAYVETAAPADSPCGVCLARGAPQLFARPARHFAYLAAYPVIDEVLVIPFHVTGELRGTLWVASHDPARRFDGEDVRLLTALADFTGATVHRLEAEAALRRGEELLRTQLRLARAMTDDVAEALFLTDAAGAVTFANRGAEALLGWPAGDLVGRPLHDVVHRRADDIVCAVADCPMAGGGGASPRYEDVFVRRDGAAIEVACSRTLLDGGDGTLVIVQDVSAWKRAERERARYASQLVGLSAAATMIHSLSLGDALAVVTEQAREIIGAHQGRITLTGGPDAVPPPVVSRSAKYAAWDAVELEPTGPVLSAPLLDGEGGPMGVLQLCDKYEGDFSAQDEAILRQLAQLASVAAQNARRYEHEHSARVAADGANAAKDAFLGILAQELRNPLGVILSGLGVLERSGTETPEATRVRELIRHHTRQLARLLDGLLDLARISQGRIQLRPGVVDLRAIADIAVQAYRDRFDARGQRVVVSVPESPVHVFGDPARLQQIAGNLLDNASKYTPTGGSVWLSVEPVNDEVLVSVRDNGLGIPSDKLEAIFELFTQLDPPPAAGDGGLGVGLTLVRRLTEMHGGRVHAHSDGRGRGSEFIVRLRLARPPAAARRRAAPTVRRSYRVLLIDAHAAARDTLRLALELEGHHVEVFANGILALEAAPRLRPDVALVDLGVPGVDGDEVARRLRAACGRAVRLFAISGDGQPEDVRHALDAGFEGHLTKPVEIDEILRILDGL